MRVRGASNVSITYQPSNQLSYTQSNSIWQMKTHCVDILLYQKSFPKKSKPNDLLENKILAFLSETYSKKVTAQDMADHVNLSRSHFSRLFKKQTGCSPRKFLNRFRVQIASQMLKKRQPCISQIATSCGFADQSHFSKSFKAVTGMTPKTYSKLH